MLCYTASIQRLFELCLLDGVRKEINAAVYLEGKAKDENSDFLQPDSTMVRYDMFSLMLSKHHQEKLHTESYNQALLGMHRYL